MVALKLGPIIVGATRDGLGPSAMGTWPKVQCSYWGATRGVATMASYARGIQGCDRLPFSY